MVTPSLPGLRIRNCPVVSNSCETVFGSIDVQRPVEGLRICISLPLLTLLIKPSRISAATVCNAADGWRFAGFFGRIACTLISKVPLRTLLSPAYGFTSTTLNFVPGGSKTSFSAAM